MVRPAFLDGISVDLSTDDLYVSQSVPDSHVAQYSVSCTAEGEGGEEHCAPEGEFGSGALVQPGRMAVNSTTGRVYVVSTSGVFGGPVDLDVFGPTVIVPSAVTGAPPTSPVFRHPQRHRRSLGLRSRWMQVRMGRIHSLRSHGALRRESRRMVGNGPKAVHADLPGLELGTTYHFRLVATSATTVAGEKGPSVGSDETFTTLGPQVHMEAVTRVSPRPPRLKVSSTPRASPPAMSSNTSPRLTSKKANTRKRPACRSAAKPSTRERQTSESPNGSAAFFRPLPITSASLPLMNPVPLMARTRPSPPTSSKISAFPMGASSSR